MKITHRKIQASSNINASDWVEGFTERVGKHFDLEREAGTAAIYEMEADGDIGYGVLVKYNGKKKRDADTFWGPNALDDAKEYAEYCLKDEIESCSDVTAASSTWDRISGLEEQIAQLEASIEDAKASGVDPEYLVDEQLELERLKDELNFAWQDDEAEYNYALEQQEFNPDGSLKGYGDGISFSTDVTASNIVPNKKIQKGMVFYTDGFTREVKSVASDRKTCKVTEDWISEDTGEPQHREYTYNIAKDEDGEYMYDPEHAEYANVGSDDYSWWARKYASGADNYPWSFDEEDDKTDELGLQESEDNEYTPSSTAGDYSPSNPWDAPGMSVKDFI